MENLNVEQVKKALECCYMQGLEHTENCPECPYTDLYPNCTEYLGKDAFALIKSQEQRIKELTDELTRKETEYNELYELCESYRLDNESVRRRMQHLCQSKFIASFDEVDRKTKEYKRNIAEADILIGVKEQYKIENIALSAEIEWLTNENKRLNKLLDDKCDRCIERERADTVRKMQERLKAECNKYLLHSTIMLRYHIDKIAKEMLEGTDNDG